MKNPGAVSLTLSRVLIGLVVVTASLCLFLLGFVSLSQAAQVETISYKPGLTFQQVSSKPDTTRVEIAPGRHITVGDLRRLEQVQQRMRATAPDSKLPGAFKIRPNISQVKLTMASQVDLSAALKLQDNATVRLPSGRIVTVAMLKYLAPIIQKQAGIDIAKVGLRPKLSGAAVKVPDANNRKRWQEIFQMPPETVLEAPDGHRVTLGEFAQYINQTTAGTSFNPVTR